MDVETLLRKVNESITAERAFGPAFEKDGCMVIPVAYVIAGGGGGKGEGTKEKEGRPPATEKGAGLGFGVFCWPIGAYAVKDGNVRWIPAVDVTRLFVLGAGVMRSLARARRRK